MQKTCGAKTRSGGKCQKAPLIGKTRCKLHGGLSTGNPNAKGNQSATKHGIYSDLIHADDLSVVDDVKSASGKIEDELLIARLQLRRALKAQANADALLDGMEVFETIEREGAELVSAKSEIKKKLRDYPQIIDRILARIESLEKTRVELAKTNGGKDDADSITRDDTVILKPDEPIPEKPVL
ncbi:HGGxSTG domain-containing protein [Solimicrobium silvestre]|uniref:Uncharacterized protein n=1 Tax=Solimicrobium silvestre TaxID=2099400 RepID=A0A2S9GY73_9BURK|nr:HGGxSTG domain-containing protein [Solimicrobium silvestre]PRC92663.1 hypothetical protein S2091_2718 [Solimicrobium silvestre]